MTIDHWMQFGTFAQQGYFAYPDKDCYTGVIINANMASYASNGLAAFIIEKTDLRKFIIDPMTHAFQHDPIVIKNKDDEPKSSIVSLAEHYGKPVSESVGNRPLKASNFNRGNMDLFVEKCIQFQYDILTREMKKSNAAKYLDDDQIIIRPDAIVAPYFYLSETTANEWLAKNIEFVNIARGYTSSCGYNKLFAAVVVSQGVLLDTDLLRDIVDAYRGSDVDGYILWVDNLDEANSSSEILKRLIHLAHNLRGKKREVINLHGGYLSILAGGFDEGFTGVSHGPEFGEFRSVIPVGGGIPISRYYIKDLHGRIRFKEALAMFKEMEWLNDAKAFHENVCGCAECIQTLNGDPNNFQKFGESKIVEFRRRGGIVRIDYPVREATEHCLKHYLQKKKEEFEFSRNSTKNDMMMDLQNGIDKYEDIAGSEGVKHLKIWKKVIEAAI